MEEDDGEGGGEGEGEFGAGSNERRAGSGSAEGSEEGGGGGGGGTAAMEEGNGSSSSADPPLLFLSGDCASSCDADGFFHSMAAAYLLWFRKLNAEVLHAPGTGSHTRKKGVEKEFARVQRGERRLKLELAMSGVFRYFLNLTTMVRGFAADDSLPGEPKARPLLPNALYACVKGDYTDAWLGRSYTRAWAVLRSRRLHSVVPGGARGLVSVVEGKDGGPPSARLDCIGWFQWSLVLSSTNVAGGALWRKPWEHSWLLGLAIAHVLRSATPVPPAIQSVLRFTRNAAVHYLLTESIWYEDPTQHALYGRRSAPEVGPRGQRTGGLLGYVLETMAVKSKSGTISTAVASVAPALRVEGDIEQLCGLGGAHELLDVLLSSIPPLEKQFMDTGAPTSVGIARLAGLGKPPPVYTTHSNWSTKYTRIFS